MRKVAVDINYGLQGSYMKILGVVVNNTIFKVFDGLLLFGHFNL